MKIVLWIGNEPNQIALAQKINRLYPLSGVFLETRKIKRKVTVLFLLGKLIEKFFFRAISKAWFGMLSYYNNLVTPFSNIPLEHVSNINSEIVLDKTKLINPDLIIVSGTSLIKDELSSLKPKIGILNLHTGLSPYIKGGPNCTNWCIASEQIHLIGNTVMWIDKGIDSGRIVYSELTKFNGNENLLDVHIKVMEHAHSIYLKAISEVSKKNIIGVNQSEIGKGKIFYNKDWNLFQKYRLMKNIRNFKRIVNSKNYIEKQNVLKTVKL
jgi:folate-dependent phosphoribosylglycinamide formyltransferase PurN